MGVQIGPEYAAFWALNHGQPLLEKKKSVAGASERLAILLQHYPKSAECYEFCLQAYSRTEVARDDILDALVGAVTALQAPNLATFPANSVFDDQCLPMEIVYAVPSNSKSFEPGYYHDDLEAKAAESVGRILFAFTRLEFNLALELRFAQGDPGDKTLELCQDTQNFKKKLDALTAIVERRFAELPECITEYRAWYRNMELVRKKRNAFVHGRWGILFTKRCIILVSNDYPGVGEKGETIFSLDALNGELADIERLARDFSKLQTKWTSFWR